MGRTLSPLLLFVLAPAAFGQANRPLDTFQTLDSRDWGGGANPTYLPDGGPGGQGDAWLRITSTGTGGAGGRLATFSDGLRWQGNYLALGRRRIVTSIQNLGNTTLLMRIVVFSTSSQRWTSRVPVVLTPFQTWRVAEWRLGPTDLVRVQGNLTYEQALQNVTQIMIRHDDEPPSAGGTPIAGSIGLDNVRSEGAPTLLERLLGLG